MSSSLLSLAFILFAAFLDASFASFNISFTLFSLSLINFSVLSIYSLTSLIASFASSFSLLNWSSFKDSINASAFFIFSLLSVIYPKGVSKKPLILSIDMDKDAL